jgi:hypothetical protein
MIQAAISQALKIFSLLLLEIWYRNTKEEQINPTENIEDSLYVEVDIIGCVAAEIISAKGSKSVSHKPGPAFGLQVSIQKLLSLNYTFAKLYLILIFFKPHFQNY